MCASFLRKHFQSNGASSVFLLLYLDFHFQDQTLHFICFANISKMARDKSNNYYCQQIWSRAFAIEWCDCECCTCWSWPTFRRTGILKNVNSSKMVVASEKCSRTTFLIRLIFAIKWDHYAPCTLWLWAKISRSHSSSGYFDKAKNVNNCHHLGSQVLAIKWRHCECSICFKFSR